MSDYRNRSYDKPHAERFVKYLGCHTFMNPVDAIKRRDPAEYRQLLQKLIEVNRTRLDSVGRAETAAAERALKPRKPA